MSAMMQMEMTLEEARETDRLIKRHINTTRYLLLDMRDRKGWKALGYESFKEYGEKELGYQENYIHKLVSAAEISLQIGVNQGGTIVQPPESQLRPLKSVPEDVRKQIWDEATAKAEADGDKRTAKHVEMAVAEWKQRSNEFRDDANKYRKMAREATQKADQLQAALDLGQEKATVPRDYLEAKEKVGSLEKEIEKLKREQQSTIEAQVRAKMRGYQSEVDDMERRKAQIEESVQRKQAYLESLSSEVKRAETHMRVIDGVRQKLIGLSELLYDADPITEPETVRNWNALAGMCDEAARAIRSVFKPALSIVQR